MKITKKKIAELNKCYSIAPLIRNGRFHFLVAAEKTNPCYLFGEDGELLETVWNEPGGVMTMVQVPNSEGQFLATHKFYSPNDSAEAKIVIATPRAKNDWEIRTLVDAPFVHRFGILERNSVNYLIVCCLKSGHKFKDDWSMPGKVYAAVLPEDLSGFDSNRQLPLKEIKAGLLKNHGFSCYCDNGVNTALVTAEEGVFQFFPPESPEKGWTIRQLFDKPVSDAVLCDFDGDGEPELGCIGPFHGDNLYICHKNADGKFEEVWKYPEPLEMLHATYACTILGKPAWIVGHRKGERNLMLITYENGGYKATIIDRDCGSANAMHFVNSSGEDIIISANRETNEIAMYTIAP